MIGTLSAEMASMAKEIEYDVGKQARVGEHLLFQFIKLIVCRILSLQMQQPCGPPTKTVTVRNWILANNGQGSFENTTSSGENTVEFKMKPKML